MPSALLPRHMRMRHGGTRGLVHGSSIKRKKVQDLIREPVC